MLIIFPRQSWYYKLSPQTNVPQVLQTNDPQASGGFVKVPRANALAHKSSSAFGDI